MTRPKLAILEKPIERAAGVRRHAAAPGVAERDQGEIRRRHGRELVGLLLDRGEDAPELEPVPRLEVAGLGTGNGCSVMVGGNPQAPDEGAQIKDAGGELGIERGPGGRARFRGAHATG